MVSSAAKRARKKKLAHERQDRELLRPTRQMDPADLTDPEMEQADDEIRFAPRGQSVEQMPATPATAQAATGCMDEDIVNMIKTLNGAIAAISRDTACIQKAYEFNSIQTNMNHTVGLHTLRTCAAMTHHNYKCTFILKPICICSCMFGNQ